MQRPSKFFVHAKHYLKTKKIYSYFEKKNLIIHKMHSLDIYDKRVRKLKQGVIENKCMLRFGFLTSIMLGMT